MSISTYFRPNIHRNDPEILGVNVKVSILKFMFCLLVLETILLRKYMMLILIVNCKVWIVVVASKSFHFYWIFCSIEITFLWEIQWEETIVEAFDMIFEVNNVLLEVDIDDYLQKLNEIVETWRAWIWYQGFKVMFKDNDMSSKINACKD
jgi:hypothetical protein